MSLTKRAFVLGTVAVLGLGASVAHAEIKLQTTTIAINNSLVTAGWSGYKLTLVSDNPTDYIASIDMKNPNAFVTGTPGLTGIFHQAWDVSGADLSTMATPTGTIPGTISARVDSMFLSASRYNATPNPFTENSNLLNGSNPPYTRSPLTDIPADPILEVNGTDYGVGSTMTFAGGMPWQQYSTVLDLAFIIFPTGSQATINAWVQSNNLNNYSIAQTITAVPEPASLALLALSVPMLITSRSRGRRTRGTR